MKTRCPHCQTVFRITPEQLKAHTGRVRCGQCRQIFNALHSLEGSPADRPAAAPVPPMPPVPLVPFSPPDDRPTEILTYEEMVIPPAAPPAAAKKPPPSPEIHKPLAPMSEAEMQEFGLSSGLILPRETTEIPGYCRWTTGPISAHSPFAPPKKPVRWPLVLTAVLLLMLLAAQAAFHFRSQLHATVPALRPALEAIFTNIPLLRHIEQIGIEASGLQSDPAHNNLLAFDVTLRNRAPYRQDYPSLELILTDMQDKVVVRRIFPPEAYLPARLAESPYFAPNTDIAVQLWLETQDGLVAAGYRVDAFYP